MASIMLEHLLLYFEIQTKEATYNAYDYSVKQSKKVSQSVGPQKQTAEAIKISEKAWHVQKLLKERENGFQPVLCLILQFVA